MLVVGIAAILQNLGALDIRLVRYPALVLLILGVTILIGAFAGRARWLVLPAILVVSFLLLASVVTVPEVPTSTAVTSSPKRKVTA